jgi:hypothetical protein
MPLGGVSWSVDPPADDSDDFHLESGTTDVDGLATLSPTALAWWGEGPMRVFGLPGADATLDRPPLGSDGVLELSIPIGGPTIHLGGSLVDTAGRPVPTGGVYVSGAGIQGEPGGPVGDDGRFARTLSLPPPDEDGPSADSASITLLGVAPGFRVATKTLPAHDASGIVLRLEPDGRHGALVLGLTHPDGTPAAGARALLWPQGALPIQALGGPFPDDDDAAVRQRALLRRLCGGRGIDDKGYEIGQGQNYLVDLVADEAGEIRIGALPSGRYHLQAVAGVTHDGQPVPATQAEIGDGWEETEDGHGIAAAEALEADVEIAPPPTPTHVSVRFEPARAAVGRLVVDQLPDWNSGDAHTFWIGCTEWPWVYVAVRMEPSSDAEGTLRRPPGTFRLAGLPRTPCHLDVVMSHAAGATVDVPAAGPEELETDVGEVHLRDGRWLHVDLAVQDDARPWGVRIRLVGYEGGSLEPRSAGGSSADFFLPTPLAGTEEIEIEWPGDPPRTRRVSLGPVDGAYGLRATVGLGDLLPDTQPPPASR